MLKNYFKIAVRSLFRNKLYSTLNIAGLAIGLAACIMLMLWISDELSYDRFHANLGSLYRVNCENTIEGVSKISWRSQPPLSPALKADIPEVSNSTRFMTSSSKLVIYDDKSNIEKKVCLADPGFFEMFSFEFSEGSVEYALTTPNSMIITESTAKRYFGGDNPLGKVLTIGELDDFIVSAVVADPPHNSHLQFDFIVPFIRLDDFFRNFVELFGAWIDDWDGKGNIVTYIQLADNASITAVNEKITKLVALHREAEGDNMMIQPLQGIHLHPLSGEQAQSGSGDIRYIYIFSVVAGFILLIACINFMNLTTARYTNRANEVGLRKVVGADRFQLIGQFYGESIFISVISFVVAITAVEILLPVFRDISGKDVSLLGAENNYFYLALFAIVILTGILSGSYPALFLSSFKPAAVFKNSFLKGKGTGGIRKGLVFFQFFISAVLIVSTVIVFTQMNYIRNKRLGYDKDHLLHIRLSDEVKVKHEAFTQELLKSPQITGVTISSSLMSSGAIIGTSDVKWEGKSEDEQSMIRISSAGFGFDETLKINMVQGDFYSKAKRQDGTGFVVINETMAELMGHEQVIGRKIDCLGEERTITGVIEDYHFESMHTAIEPLILCNFPDYYRIALVRIDSRDIPAALSHIESVWHDFDAEYPLRYGFTDEDFNRLYTTEMNIRRVLLDAVVLAIFIASLGLFGLSAFTAERKTKEIGIRMVLGATVTNIVKLMSKEFVILITLANIIAWPAAWLAITKWLNNFAYRIELADCFWIFPVSAVLSVIIATMMVGFQSVRAASANPIKSLRYE